MKDKGQRRFDAAKKAFEDLLAEFSNEHPEEMALASGAIIAMIANEFAKEGREYELVDKIGIMAKDILQAANKDSFQ